MAKYYWTVECSDGGYNSNSEKLFDTMKEAYEDMRNAALEKMKWNTEFDEDFENNVESIGYSVSFERKRIVHQSYSGIYTYEIKEVEMIELEGLDEEIKPFAEMINKAWKNERHRENFITILLAILKRDEELYRNNFDANVKVTEEYVNIHATDILNLLCDVEDYKVILSFIGFQPYFVYMSVFTNNNREQ